MRDLSKRIAALADDKRDLLDALLQDEGLDISTLPMRPRRSPHTTSFPLSFAQQRMWFLHQLTPNDPFYNMTAAFRVRGDVNHAALTAAFNQVFERHEVLRTTFHRIQGQPMQTVRAHRPFSLPVEDLSELPATQREARVRQLAIDEGQRVFDLTHGGFLAVRLLRLERAYHVLLLTLHHIVADGWSLGVLQRELASLYASYCGQPSPPLPELPIQYADFAQWERDALRGAALESQLGYWRRQLTPLPQPLQLPTDRPRPAEQTFRGRRLEIELPGPLRDALKQSGQRHGATLFMVLLGAFQLLLGRYAGQDDVVVGSPIANRNRREIEDLIGFFANSLALRTDLSGNPTFGALLAQVRETMLGAYANQDIPFEMLVEHLQPKRDLSRNPFFQVAFALQNAPLAPWALRGLDIEPLELDNETTRFDLELHLWERPSGLTGYFVYNSDLFDASTIRRLALHFTALLEHIAAHPEEPIDALQWEGQAALAPACETSVTALPIAEVESALRRHPLVEDCVVLARQRLAGDQALVAYVVWTGNAAATALSAALFPALPQPLPPLYLTPVAALPLTASGDIDAEALTRLDVIDATLAERWERRLQALPEIDQAVVIARETSAPQASLHLADLIPGWSARAPASDPRDASEASEPPPLRDAPLSGSAPSISHGAPLHIADNAPRHLAAALRRAADQQPRHGVVYLQPDGSDRTQSYPALLDEAQRIVAGLRALGLQPGDMVILQLERNEDFIPAFWGCVLGGFVAAPLAVPATYDAASNSAVNKLLHACRLLDAPLVLTSAANAADVLSLGARHADGLRVAVIDELRQGNPDARVDDAAPDDLALLLLTSGSTGQPKAVMHTHHSLLSRSAATAQMNGFCSGDISLNWMPLDHVGGLVMFHVHDVCVACQQIHAPITQVLQQPLRWLDWIESYRATVTWAPNFAYGLINDQADALAQRRWDLASMRFILNGGEAIAPKTARRFLQLLAPHGLPAACMHPAWGMSETASGVTFAEPFQLGQTSDGDTFVSVGAPIPGVSIRIVDDQGALLPEGAVGSLQVAGAPVTCGYYQAANLNAEAFTTDGWFCTGDLGWIRDGRLTITGREKDVIIINGVNFYCHEIEASVETLAGVEASYTAACAVRDANSDTDRLAIFFSPSAAGADELELLGAIRQHILQDCGVNPAYIIPVAPDDIPKTEIGKIQRAALKQRFEAGGYETALKRIDILRGHPTHTLPDWFYRKIWRRAAWRPHSEPSNGAAPALSLVFLDRLGLGRQVADRLAETHGPCVLVEAGAAFAQLAADHFRIDPTQPEHYRDLMAAIAADDRRIDRILHLWLYDDDDGGMATIDTLAAAQYAGLYSLLFTVQALGPYAEADGAVRQLLVISRQAQTASPDDPVACEKSTIIGLLKTIALELPWLHCRHIDFDGETLDSAGDLAQRELTLEQGEPEVAYRRAARLIPKLEKIEMGQPQRQTPPLQTGGVYLLAGGLGGIGAQVARFLMTAWSAKLIVIGRTALPERESWPGHVSGDTPLSARLQNYVALEAAAKEADGGEFVYRAADVCDLDALELIVAEAEARWRRPLAGIIHLAGEEDLARHWANMEQHRIMVERPQTFESMFRAKVYGAWTLSQLLKPRPQASFIAFSSVHSIFGAATFGAYAAANSFLDAFTVSQRHHGHAASYAFNWSMWDDLGMSRATPEHARTATHNMGYDVLSQEQGLQALMAGLWRDEAQLIVGLDGGNRRIRRHLETSEVQTQRLCAYLTGHDAEALRHLPAIELRDDFGAPSRCDQVALAEMPRTSDGDIDRQALQAMGRQTQAAATERVAPATDLERAIAAIWAEALQTEVVSVTDNFFELGGHSILLAQVHGKLCAALDRDLSIVDLFRYPTIRALAAHLGEIQEEKPTYQTVQDRAAKQRVALQRQRQLRRTR